MPLGPVADLLADADDRHRRERREIVGIGFTMATVLMLLNFIVVFGVITLPHLSNPVFLWIWAGFVVGSLVVGGLGLANLIRGGFFRKLKEREARLQLNAAGQERRPMAGEAERAGVEAAATPLPQGPLSVTETTTRELEAVPRAGRRASR